MRFMPRSFALAASLVVALGTAAIGQQSSPPSTPPAMRHYSIVATAAVAQTLATSSPRIAGITPSAPTRSPSAQILTINGEHFMPGLSLTVGTPSGGSLYLADADIQALRDTAFQVSVTLATAGTYSLTVTNIDGGVSAPFGLQVRIPVEAPVIDLVTPAKGLVQPDPQVFRVEGKRFASGLVVNLAGPNGDTTTVSGNDVSDVRPDSFRMSVVLSLEGPYTMTVRNPDGSQSNAVSIDAVRRIHR